MFKNAPLPEFTNILILIIPISSVVSWLAAISYRTDCSSLQKAYKLPISNYCPFKITTFHFDGVIRIALYSLAPLEVSF
jgi:hypothetical protein